MFGCLKCNLLRELLKFFSCFHSVFRHLLKSVEFPTCYYGQYLCDSSTPSAWVTPHIDSIQGRGEQKRKTFFTPSSLFFYTRGPKSIEENIWVMSSPLGKGSKSNVFGTSLTMMDLNCLGKNLRDGDIVPVKRRAQRCLKGLTAAVAVAANAENREIASVCPSNQSARSWVVLPILLLFLAPPVLAAIYHGTTYLPYLEANVHRPAQPFFFFSRPADRPNISHLISMHLISPSPLSHTQG